MMISSMITVDKILAMVGCAEPLYISLREVRGTLIYINSVLGEYQTQPLLYPYVE